MLVFPAIDLIDGCAVRLAQGKRDSVTVYSRAPAELAVTFAAAGAPRLHVVDLDAAFSGGAKHNRDTIRQIAAASTVPIEVGGGVRSAADCQRLFDLGARFVVLGTAAIKTPELIDELCARFPRRVVVAVDARDGMVAVEAWTETSAMEAAELGEAAARAGAAAILYTDVGRDGMRTGPNVEATDRLARRLSPCPVIASGGVATLDDIDALARGGAYAVVVGKALYEKVFTVEEAIARAYVRAP